MVVEVWRIGTDPTSSQIAVNPVSTGPFYLLGPTMRSSKKSTDCRWMDLRHILRKSAAAGPWLGTSSPGCDSLIRGLSHLCRQGKAAAFPISAGKERRAPALDLRRGFSFGAPQPAAGQSAPPRSQTAA